MVYAGQRGFEMTKIVDDITDVPATTDRIEFTVAGSTAFLFDDIKVMTRSGGSTTLAFTYGPGNQLTQVADADGVTVDLEYDAWGRVKKAEYDVLGNTYTTEYAYWFGDKLKRVDSDWLFSPELVHYLYDGLGKRRVKLVDNEYTQWRWDAGYSVLAAYGDATASWAFGDTESVFTPFGHTALAEAVLDQTGNPANAVYHYLGHDHLGTGRFAYNHAKAQVGMAEHEPYGERINSDGYTPYHELAGAVFDGDVGSYYAFGGYYYSVAPSFIPPYPICGGGWATIHFIMHYYFGGGRTVSLSDIGLLDRYRSNPIVSSFISQFKEALRMKSRIKANQLKQRCKGCPIPKHVNGRIFYNRQQLTNFTGDICLHVLGEGFLHANGNCGITLNCRTKRYKYSCGLSFHQNDMFTDPVDLGVELGIGRPYDIIAIWHDELSGGGSV